MSTPLTKQNTPDILSIQREIVEDFGLFSEWTEKYQYLIDLGRQLESFEDAWKTEDNRLHGCQSQVWLVMQGDIDQVLIRAASDSAIVSGLIALVTKVYSGQSAQVILDTEPNFIESIGLKQHLSPTRSNGLHAMLGAIKQRAKYLLQDAA